MWRRPLCTASSSERELRDVVRSARRALSSRLHATLRTCLARPRWASISKDMLSATVGPEFGEAGQPDSCALRGLGRQGHPPLVEVARAQLAGGGVPGPSALGLAARAGADLPALVDRVHGRLLEVPAVDQLLPAVGEQVRVAAVAGPVELELVGQVAQLRLEERLLRFAQLAVGARVGGGPELAVDD